jgi:hypothetical protein
MNWRSIMRECFIPVKGYLVSGRLFHECRKPR